MAEHINRLEGSSFWKAEFVFGLVFSFYASIIDDSSEAWEWAQRSVNGSVGQIAKLFDVQLVKRVVPARAKAG